VFQKFQDFQKLVERQFNHKILAVQSDLGGGGYRKLNSLFTKLNIVHHVSCPHVHQQNGAVERKHHRIVEVGLPLLSHVSMPLKFWDEAFLTAAYLINRLPSKTIDNLTPLECLIKKPDYSALHMFRCACWPHLRLYNSHKLQFWSKQCVFLGYSDLRKGYKCQDVSSGRIYISRDVIFDKEVFPFSKLHPNAGARLRSKIELLPPTLIHVNIGTGVGQGANQFTDISPNVTNVAFDFENQVQNDEEEPGEERVAENGIDFIQNGQESASGSQPAATSGATSTCGVPLSVPGAKSSCGTCITASSPLSPRAVTLLTDDTRYGGGQMVGGGSSVAMLDTTTSMMAMSSRSSSFDDTNAIALVPAAPSRPITRARRGVQQPKIH
jgi:hypothetical protein